MQQPLIKKAIIPAAGLGTRHFPASHAVKKELFPVVGPDGISRALIHYQISELVDAGIEEICVIVQPGDDTAISAYLKGPSDAYLRRLEKYPELFREAIRMRQLSSRVNFATQYTQEGFGHAVLQAKEFAAGQRVLLCLGDHLFRGNPESPYKELIIAASQSGALSVSAVNRIGPGELKGFGTIAGKRHTHNPRLIDVEIIIEKPDVQTARLKLRVDGLEEDQFLGWFGMHAFAPSIFDILEQMVHDDIRDNGEFQLTRAQEIQRQKEGYLALEMTTAERFDFGVPDDYVKSLQAFRH
jgi:UTP--glucose-1-phosphate uridylyltransferase